MKRKYQLFVVFVVFVGLSFSARNQNYSNKVTIEFLDFEKFGNSSKQSLLYFKIKNNTNDTLYLSRKNIIIEAMKDGKLLKENENTTMGQIIFSADKKNKSKRDAENLHEEATASLRSSFAEKLYFKNFAKSQIKTDKEFVIRVIENDCIVIFPNKTVNYSRIFINSFFSRNCKINARYQNNKIFSYYMTGNEKKVDIKI